MMLIVFLMVNTKKKPFVSLALNDLETYSMTASMITPSNPLNSNNPPQQIYVNCQYPTP